MPHRTYSSPPSQEHKRSFNHVSTRKLSTNSPYRPESRRKHTLAPWRPFGASTTPQDPTSKSNDGYSSKPRCLSRLSTNEETTTLDKIWGSLFDEDCQPTARLGQLLRGLAMHIIEDFEPCHSIVITPAKMISYYKIVKLQNELYPWSTIFDEHSSISRMYRDLKCLTPVGFERWMTLLIQAHPEEEYRRLQKAVLDMPISNPDKRERFPKDISRRLFPKDEERGIRGHVEWAIAKYANIQLPRSLNRKGPQSHRDTSFHTSSTDKQIYKPQNHGHRSVSFVLPTDVRS